MKELIYIFDDTLEASKIIITFPVKIIRWCCNTIITLLGGE